MMSLHASKNLALLQLTNCMSSCNVKTIKQLSDGKIFLSIIETVFPEKALHLQNEKKQCNEHSKDEDVAMDQDSNESNKETESSIKTNECIAVKSDCTKISNEGEFIDVALTETVGESSEQISVDINNEMNSEDKNNVICSEEGKCSPVKNADEKDEDTSKRYELIESFIDEKYNLQSGSLITYEDCMTANEFELAKVILFIVSEVIQHYVQSKNPIIQTLSHLDIKVQQDLEDCFNLFINEKAKITETDINKLLSSPALYKVSPSRSSFVTPKRTCSSKYRRTTSPLTSPLQDSVFIDSPLKTYFESPIFTKKDILTKEKEIFKTRQNLYNEEMKSSSLELTIKELEKKLRNKDNEIKNLKTRIKEFEETEKSENCENCAILSGALKEKEKTLHNKDIQMKEQYKELEEKFQEEYENYRIEIAECISKWEFDFKNAENECKKLEIELDDVKFNSLKKEEDIKHLVNELEEKTKVCEILKEKLSATSIEKSKIPEYSICGESIGGVIEKENEELRQRINQLELLALSKKNAMVDAMVQCTENILDCKVMENSIVSKDELPSIPYICEETESVIISESPKGCSNIHVDKKNNTISSFATDAIPVSLNNNNSIQNYTFGALWKQVNDSMAEYEATHDRLHKKKYLHKSLSSTQRYEAEIRKHFRHYTITSRANGSNGLVNSSAYKEVMEIINALKKCLAKELNKCNSQFLNNISMSNCSEVENSNVAVDSVYDTSLEKEEEISSSVHSSVSQDSAALQEKIKEFDVLKEQYLTTIASLGLKEKELNAYKKKYFLEKRANFENVQMLRDLEITSQKLHAELKELKKNESDLKKIMKKEKLRFKFQMQELSEKHNKLIRKYESLQRRNKILYDQNQKLEHHFPCYRNQYKDMILQAEKLENQVKENSHAESLAEQSTTIPCTQGPVEQTAQLIPKTEPLSPNEYEASSINTNIELSVAGSALRREIPNAFQFRTDDEESFIDPKSIERQNHRNSLYNFSYGEIAEDRITELKRRNTLCPSHLKSIYPGEGAPLNFSHQHSSNYVNFEGAKKDGEIESKEPAGKKRKMSEMKTKDQSSDVVKTPSTNRRSWQKTSHNLHKMLTIAGRRYRRDDTIKPKP